VFYTRKGCPVCASPGAGSGSDTTRLHTASFSDPVLRDFLDRFYQGRINLDMLAEYDFELAECKQCKLVFQQHLLNEQGMQLLYDEWIDPEKSLLKRQQGKAKLFRKYAAECETISRMVNKNPHQTRVLEFGMGWGYWSRTARAFNYDVIGMELSELRINHAATMGVSAAQDVSQIERGSIDFIYANQVFEHLTEPMDILTSLTELLTPSGIMLIRVPDGRGIAAKLGTSGWQPSMQAIHPLEHINCFTRHSLIHMAKQAGLRPISAPVRLSCNSGRHFYRSLMRELRDRFTLPHIYFTPC